MVNAGRPVSRQGAPVPRYFLYGEAAKPVEECFVHLEAIERRSRPNDWIIRPHAHAALHHLFLIETGGGALHVDGVVHEFAAPALLLVPAGRVHSFSFEPETVGRVVTFADRLLRDLQRREPALGTLLTDVRCLPLVEKNARSDLWQWPAAIERELDFPSLGSGLAVEALLASLLIDALRLERQVRPEAASRRSPRIDLVARYRALLEAHLHDDWSITAFAAALAVTTARLRRACVEVTGQASIELRHDRLVTEAKRSLIYTNMTVAEIGIDLGFEDPGYFSRFFTRRVGMPPGAFRARHAASAFDQKPVSV